ncbi:MAG: ribulokinase [Kiritimatiellaeota bacterium]|nr:ribulokinase [Kiritimatiellota bacterium]
MKRYAIGVDYGTNSCRALVVDVATGRELASKVFGYPTGVDGVIVDARDPNVARQNPADYIAGFMATVTGAIALAKKADKAFRPESVVGIGVDTTGSTPIPVGKDGVPLAMTKKFAKHPAAQAWLWKDHTAFAEAAAITAMAKKRKEPYLAKCGGTYSSEWFWSKVWHCQKTAPDVFEAAYSWVELCDFVPAYITGNLDPLTMKRGICAAGHKAMFSEEWGGLPSAAFLKALSPKLAALRPRLYAKAYASDEVAGTLTEAMAKETGLKAGTPVAVGAFDAHHGGIGAGIKPGTLVKIMGTSTCDIMVAAKGAKVKDIPGVCGIVTGSVVPGLVALEAGQSAVGDIFKWYVDTNCPVAYTHGNAYANLEKEAGAMKPGASGLIALDWNNGNRTVLVDPLLTGLVVGQTLHTTGAELFRAYVEATAFGALTIINRVEEYGVKVKEVVACGGLAEKSPFTMQLYADVCNRPMKISRSAQTCALGAAIFGAVVGGIYKDTATAQKAMTGVKDIVYTPIPAHAKVYAQLYAVYRALHDAFGLKGTKHDLSWVMKELIRIRQTARVGK